MGCGYTLAKVLCPPTYSPPDTAYQGAVQCQQYHPSRDWLEGGLIISRERMYIEPHGVHWTARLHYESQSHHGETPLIAAMRCYVASKLGEEVDIPDELK